MFSKTPMVKEWREDIIEKAEDKGEWEELSSFLAYLISVRCMTEREPTSRGKLDKAIGGRESRTHPHQLAVIIIVPESFYKSQLLCVVTTWRRR